MPAFVVATLLVLCCLASVAQAGARERLPFIPEVELREELLPGENYSFAEQLQGGKEAWGKGFLQFQGVQEHDGSVSANIGVRSFLDGRFQVSLMPGDFFLAGNRYFKVEKVERALSGPFKGSYVLTLVIFKSHVK